MQSEGYRGKHLVQAEFTSGCRIVLGLNLDELVFVYEDHRGTVKGAENDESTEPPQDFGIKIVCHCSVRNPNDLHSCFEAGHEFWKVQPRFRLQHGETSVEFFLTDGSRNYLRW